MSDTTKGAQISAIVQQLKHGKITKQELFQKLQRLQAGEVVVPEALATVSDNGNNDKNQTQENVLATEKNINKVESAGNNNNVQTNSASMVCFP